MANNAHITAGDIDAVRQGQKLADLSKLVFRDPDCFRAGELHRHVSEWHSLLHDLNSDLVSEVHDWIKQWC